MHPQKFAATKFNVLKGIDRKALPESLRLNKIGLDGLSRYDVNPAQDHKQKSINSFYVSELQRKKGTTDVKEPIFTIKGLQNFSRLPQGDDRVPF